MVRTPELPEGESPWTLGKQAPRRGIAKSLPGGLGSECSRHNIATGVWKWGPLRKSNYVKPFLDFILREMGSHEGF